MVHLDQHHPEHTTNVKCLFFSVFIWQKYKEELLLQKAKLRYKEDLLLHTAEHGINHPVSAKKLSKISYLHVKLGNYDEAASCMAKVMRYQDHYLDENDAERQAAKNLVLKIEKLRQARGSGLNT